MMGLSGRLQEKNIQHAKCPYRVAKILTVKGNSREYAMNGKYATLHLIPEPIPSLLYET